LSQDAHYAWSDLRLFGKNPSFKIAEPAKQGRQHDPWRKLTRN
jgi:hypothetical protein